MNNDPKNTTDSHPLKKDVSHHLPNFARYRKEFWSALVLVALVIAIALGSYYVRERQELRQQASTDLVDISFNPSSLTLNENESAQITVVMDTNTKTVSAVDLYINNSNPSVLTINDVSLYSNSTLLQGLPDPSPLANGATIQDTNNKKSNWLDLSSNPIHLTLGTSCTDSSTAGCNAVQDPAAHIVVIDVTANNDGNATLSIGNSSQVAAIEVAGTSDDNVIGDLSTASLTVEGTTTGPVACDADIVDNSGNLNPDGTVGGADFDFVTTYYDPFESCSGDGCAADIVDNNGQLPSDGTVGGADFDFVTTHYDPFGNCSQ